MKKKWLTFTNILFVLAIIVYILNVFVISPDTGSTAKEVIKIAQEQGANLTIVKILGMIFGEWGGHVNDLLGFQMQKVLSGEVWRIYTVVLTHGHLPHIAMNMAALLIAGNHIEKKMGTKKIILLFLLLTAINNFASEFIYVTLLRNELVLSTGASGWITSLMGMILMKCVLDKEYKNELSGKARFYLVFYFISTTFLFGFNAFTFAAHMCGMIAGMVTEFILQKIRDRRQKLEVV